MALISHELDIITNEISIPETRVNSLPRIQRVTSISHNRAALKDMMDQETIAYDVSSD